MKKNTLIISGSLVVIALLAFFILLNGKRETLIVDYPSYKEKSSRAIEILRVVCNDTATILNMEVVGPPKNWVRLRRDVHLYTDGGKQYKLLKHKGIELDKECFLPESGKMRFLLEFEPLPEKAKSFSFSEGNHKGGWNIRGIRLTDELPKGFFRYTLKGTIPTSAFDGQQIPIYRYNNSSYIGKATIKDNHFEYHGMADSAMYCRMEMGQYFGNFIVEEGVVNVDMETWMYPSGTPLNEAYAEFARLDKKVSFIIDSLRQSIIQGKMDREIRIRKLNDLEYDFDIRRGIMKEVMKPFILKHSNDEAGAAALQSYFAFSTPEMLDDIYPHLGPWILSRAIIQDEIAKINQSRKMAIGQPFIDFEGEDVNGNKVKLSDYVGKGKYVIVDFSASWCGPCKAEMPVLANVYNTYKHTNFDMVTVMVWDQLEASKKMLKDFDVNWKSIINVGMKPMELYGFSGIPRIILFAPDGSIVHNNLLGNLIKEKLEELLVSPYVLEGGSRLPK